MDTPKRIFSAVALAFAVLALVIGVMGVPHTAQARPQANIDVADGEVDVADNGQCSLVEAIVNANNDAQTYADCAGGNGADTIVLPAGSVFSLDNPDPTDVTNLYTGLPVISSTITIQTDGAGATIQRSATATDNFRLFYVNLAGSLTLNNITLEPISKPALEVKCRHDENH